ncbi:MAG TPA: NAD-binding protein, partial [Armatimonadota bacterium]|nr:NAD-binding protein [Armatimonadota bacterium]
MDKLISEMRDHYIICGYGRMGKQVATDLRQHNVPVVVIEDNPVHIPELIEQGIPYIEGKATEDKILIAAGAERAKGIVAVAASDEENVFITLTARVLNPNLFIVARSILEENEDKLKRAGANRVVSPYILGGHRIAAAVLKPRVMAFLDVALQRDNLDIEIGDVVVSSSAPFAGKTIRESGFRESTGATILAIKRANEKIVGN